MIISSRRVGPRLPAWVNDLTEKAPESWTLVLVATLGAGRSVARKRAGGALPLPPTIPPRDAVSRAPRPRPAGAGTRLLAASARPLRGTRDAPGSSARPSPPGSEERRVGKECRSR